MQKKAISILVADDDEDDLEIVEESILTADPDIRLHKFSNGKSAIKYLNQSDEAELPHLIILDFNMPELKGSEVVGIINRDDRFKKIPKIILSTSNASFHIRECMNSGADEYFIKPDTKKEMDMLIRKIISLARPE